MHENPSEAKMLRGRAARDVIRQKATCEGTHTIHECMVSLPTCG